MTPFPLDFTLPVESCYLHDGQMPDSIPERVASPTTQKTHTVSQSFFSFFSRIWEAFISLFSRSRPTVTNTPSEAVQPLAARVNNAAQEVLGSPTENDEESDAFEERRGPASLVPNADDEASRSAALTPDSVPDADKDLGDAMRAIRGFASRSESSLGSDEFHSATSSIIGDEEPAHAFEEDSDEFLSATSSLAGDEEPPLLEDVREAPDLGYGTLEIEGASEHDPDLEDTAPAARPDYEQIDGIVRYYNIDSAIEKISGTAIMFELTETPEMQTITGPIQELANLGVFEKVEFNGHEFTFYLSDAFKGHEDVTFEQKNGLVIVHYKDAKIETCHRKFTVSVLGAIRMSVEYESPLIGMQALSETAKEHGITQFDLFKDKFLPQAVSVKRYTENGQLKMNVYLDSPYSGKIPKTRHKELGGAQSKIAWAFEGADVHTMDRIAFSFNQRTLIVEKDGVEVEEQENYIRIEDDALMAKVNFGYLAEKTAKGLARAFLGGWIQLDKPFALTEIREKDLEGKRVLGFTAVVQIKRTKMDKEAHSVWFTEESFPKTFDQLALQAAAPKALGH